MIIITTNIIDDDGMLFIEPFYSLFHNRNCSIISFMGPIQCVACLLLITYWGEILIQLKCFQGNCFKVNNSEAFTPFTVLCNHHLYPVPKHFQHCKAKPWAHEAISPGSFLPPAPGKPPPYLCSVAMCLSILDLSCKRNHTLCSLLSGVFCLASWFGGSSTV